MSESHYDLIGVEPDASKDEIRSAYRERIEALRGKVENGRSDKARDGAREETARLNSAWRTARPCVNGGSTAAPVSVSHTCALWSSLLVTKRRPSGLKLACTSAACS